MKSRLTMILLAALAAGCHHSTMGAPGCDREPVPVDPASWPEHDVSTYQGAWVVPLPTAADPTASIPVELSALAWTSEWFGFNLSSSEYPECDDFTTRQMDRTFSAQVSLADDPVQSLPFTFTDWGDRPTDGASWDADLEVSVGHVPEVRAFLADLVSGDEYDVDAITDVFAWLNGVEDAVVVKLRVVHEPGAFLPLEARLALRLEATRAP